MLVSGRVNKVQYFTNLDFLEMRAPISFPFQKATKLGGFLGGFHQTHGMRALEICLVPQLDDCLGELKNLVKFWMIVQGNRSDSPQFFSHQIFAC